MANAKVTLTSASNEKLKHARRVREGREKLLIFVEGLRLVEECLRSKLELQSCFHTPEPEPRMAAAVKELMDRGVPCYAVQPQILAALSDTVTTQGIIVIAQRPMHQLDTVLRGTAPLVLGLDRVQDPGNVGTLIRTAEAAGVSGIILLHGCADPFSPKSLRSAMGSAFRLPIVARPTDMDRPGLGLKMVAAAGSGDVLHYDYDWRQPTLLWLGNEGSGLDPELIESADVRLRIPLQAGVESLNVAAAGAAMLFEAVRQRVA